MANLPKISWKNMNGWVPTNETDDVDLDTKFATEMSNVRFKNGFIENDVSIANAGLHTSVATEISSNGYSLLSVCVFVHSVEGQQYVYILWNNSASAADKLKIYLGNTELNLDEQGDDIEFSDEPTEINYNLVNDQLKINLNVTGNYGDIGSVISGTDVILNLSLVYLDALTYNSSNSIERSAGWYLFPRWAGWSYNDVLLDDIGTNVEDFEDAAPFEYSLNLGAWSRSTDDAYAGTYSAKLPSGSTQASISSGGGHMTLTATNPQTLVLYIKGHEYPSIQLDDDVYYAQDGQIQQLDDGWKRIGYQLNYTGVANMTIFIGDNLTNNDIFIDNISVDTDASVSNNLAVIGLYHDGQRALIDAAISVERKLSITVSEIDWRIVAYEVYEQNQTTGAWFLTSKTEVDDNFGYDANVGGKPFVSLYPVQIEESTISLDFNYNLPYDSRVDNQKNIYSEITYKGRVYFVKDDYKVYQSHIAGNGVIQPDAFPYDEVQGFGYFVVSRESENRALAISPVDDLVVFTPTNTYVYRVQASGGGVFRSLRRVSGSVGLASRKSLLRTKGGHPATEGLFWYDYNGIYMYVGGIESPKNILEPAHKRYWQETFSTTHKDNGLGFYNSVDDEYIAVVNGKMLTYEIKFGKFNIHDLGSDNVDEFIGVLGNITYVRDGNEVKSLSKTASAFNVKTNYSSAGDEYLDKILQEFYIIFGPETASTAVITVTLYWDNFAHSQTFNIIASRKYHILPMPIMRFKKVAVKITNTESKVITINDLGVSYIPDPNNALAQNV
jgi:hypothetical protein